MSCPYCDGCNLRPSRRTSLVEKVLMWFGYRAYRCMGCSGRFLSPST